MREIKFRAWHRINEDDEKSVMDYEITLHLVGTYRFNSLVKGLHLMQYTGLTDWNEKEIYEGDIVEVKDVGFGYKYIGVINWNKETLSYQLGISKEYPTMPAGLRDIIRTLKHHSFEIIGNIYENPELLK